MSLSGRSQHNHRCVFYYYCYYFPVTSCIPNELLLLLVITLYAFRWKHDSGSGPVITSGILEGEGIKTQQSLFLLRKEKKKYWKVSQFCPAVASPLHSCEEDVSVSVSVPKRPICLSVCGEEGGKMQQSAFPVRVSTCRLVGVHVCVFDGSKVTLDYRVWSLSERWREMQGVVVQGQPVTWWDS